MVAGTGKELGEWLEEQERGPYQAIGGGTSTGLCRAEGRQARRTRERRRERAGNQAFVTGLAYRVGLPSEAVRGLESVAHTGEDVALLLEVAGDLRQGSEDPRRRRRTTPGGKRCPRWCGRSWVGWRRPRRRNWSRSQQMPPPGMLRRRWNRRRWWWDEAWMVSQIVDHIEFLPKLGLFPERGIVGTRVELAPASREGPKLQWVVEGFDLEEDDPPREACAAGGASRRRQNQSVWRRRRLRRNA